MNKLANKKEGQVTKLSKNRIPIYTGLLLLCMAFHTVGCGRSTAGLTKQFGTTKNDCATAVVLDSQGNIYLVGNTDGNLFGPNLGGTDVFVVKYSAEGNREWKFRFGSDQDDCANSACIDSRDNIYIAGDTSGSPFAANAGKMDGFVARVSPDGTIQWSKQFGTKEEDHAWGIAVDSPRDALYVSGGTRGKLFGERPKTGLATDFFVAKCDLYGKDVWAKQFDTSRDTEAFSLAVDSLGNVFVGGTTSDRQKLSAADQDAFIAKLTTKGAIIWQRSFDSKDKGSLNKASSICVDDSGSAYLVGVADLAHTNGAMTAFTAKYDSKGMQLWLKQAEIGRAGQATHNDRHKAVQAALDEQGNVYVIGVTSRALYGPELGAADAFIAKYDPCGNILFSTQLGTSAGDAPQGITVSKMGDIYLSGGTKGDLYEKNTGNEDAFLAKFDAVATPTVNPADGLYQSTQKVTISCATSGAIIHYTTDGTGPTEASAVYKEPIAVRQSLLLKARAWKEGCLASNIRIADYDFRYADLRHRPKKEDSDDLGLTIKSCKPEGIVGWEGNEGSRVPITINLEGKDTASLLALSLSIYPTAIDNRESWKPIRVLTHSGVTGKQHVFIWDGKDDQGKYVESDVYTFDVTLRRIHIVKNKALVSTYCTHYRSDYLSVIRGVDAQGAPLFDSEYDGEDDNGTPNNPKDDSLRYYFGAHVYKDTKGAKASQGEVLLYDPDFKLLKKWDISTLPCRIHQNKKDGLLATKEGLQHDMLVKEPVDLQQFAGTYRYITRLKDGHGRDYKDGKDRWALEFD